ncbi:hypothetical protein V8G61_00040 [Gaetbulibacter sp. M240]|uniref:hypothetical protein n=1 Tax=Gaetbulibacter sp. M240 TaxID=3126511 RepID=UPI00374E4545
MIDIEKYEKQLKTKIEMFSGSFMNNSKWTKLFIGLSNNLTEIKKCYIKSVFDDILREIKIPKTDNFNDSFSKTGIKDNILTGGPCEFKEIEQIIFPYEWKSDRQMRDQKLEPKKFNQNIDKIKIMTDSIGEFEMEIDNENLIIYGYR